MRPALTLLILFFSIRLSAGQQQTPPFNVELPSDDQILNQLRMRLSGRDGKVERQVRRVGNKTIVMENFISTEVDTKVAPSILSDTRHYADWITKDINQRSSGGSFLSQLHGISVDPADPGLVMAEYSFDLPFFKTHRTAKFRVDVQNKGGVFTLSSQSIDDDATFSTAKAILKLFPGEKTGQGWLYVRGVAQLRSWVLYEAFPERVLNAEAGERLRILIDNYLREESVRRASVGQPASAKKSKN